jgi:sarcosine oxidase gamma subunit
MSPRTLARLDLGARRRGEAKARTAERLIDEGLRMEDHPGIVLKEGPTGRRAALAFGPDVWQVVKVVKEFGSAGEQAIAGAAEWGNLSHAQVNVALRYYGDFCEEVDARIAFNREETERQYAAWKRTQQALA